MAEKRLTTAFMEPAFPCNPLPFLNALYEGCKDNGFDWIRTDEAKSMIHIINSLSYGQLYSIDGMDEYSRLKKSMEQTVING